MAKIIDDIKIKARQLQKHIVLPDATDERAIQAAKIIVDEGLARISLIGIEEAIRSKAQKLGVGLDKIQIVDPAQSKKLNAFVQIYFDLRKAKGYPRSKHLKR